MNIQTESCLACPGPGPYRERYGKKWCQQCLRRVEFEERLAAQHGTAIADVVVVDGSVGFVMEANADKPPATLGLTHDLVLAKLSDASRELRQSVTFRPGGGVVAISATTRELHRRFMELIAEYRSFLGAGEDAEALALFESLAHSVGVFLAKWN
jgi:hypothetical protein